MIVVFEYAENGLVLKNVNVFLVIKVRETVSV